MTEPLTGSEPTNPIQNESCGSNDPDYDCWSYDASQHSPDFSWHQASIIIVNNNIFGWSLFCFESPHKINDETYKNELSFIDPNPSPFQWKFSGDKKVLIIEQFRSNHRIVVASKVRRTNSKANRYHFILLFISCRLLYTITLSTRIDGTPNTSGLH